MKVLIGTRTHTLWFIRYKSGEAFGEVLLSYLDEWAAKQAAAGTGDDDEKDYPF